jgi:hypothetical protein
MSKLTPTLLSVDICLELKNYVKDVWIERHGTHGGIMRITLEKGEKIVSMYRLHSECKEAFMKFPAKLRVSAKSKRNLL